jgi:hypothetical protein
MNRFPEVSDIEESSGIDHKFKIDGKPYLLRLNPYGGKNLIALYPQWEDVVCISPAYVEPKDCAAILMAYTAGKNVGEAIGSDVAKLKIRQAMGI